MATQTIIAPAVTPGGATSTVRLASPSQYVLDGSEFLSVSCNLLNAPVNITMLVRILQPGGLIQVERFSYQHASVGVPQTALFSPGAGAILGIAVFEDSGTSSANLYGDNFCTVGVSRGGGAGAVAIATLVQGYITRFFAINWPGMPSKSPLDGQGDWTQITTTPVPNGAAAWIIGINPGQRMRVTSVMFTITTDAVAGTRTPVFDFFNGNTSCFGLVALATQGPSITRSYSLLAGMADKDLSVFGAQQVGIPERVTMTFAQSWHLTFFGGDAGDTISNAVLYGERWVDPS